MQFYGASLLYFEHEYLEQFIGCCVNDGFGLLLQGIPSKEIVNFAAAHSCKVKESGQTYIPFEINKEFEENGIKIEAVFELSCRANDAP